MNDEEYRQQDAVGLAESVRSGEVTARELVELAIGRIERLNPQLNAVIHKLYDRARERADELATDADGAGPLRGVPFLLKDLLTAYGGAPLTGASRFFKDYVPAADGIMLQRYRQAGLIVVGKTNTPELGIVPTTEPELFGPTRNPWNLDRIPGGSSGGSAAAVAARMVPAAHGGDGGGSIRIPASCTGLFGLKPSRGRNPGHDDFGIWHHCVQEHVLTRSVRDSAALLDATQGPRPGAPPHLAPPERPYLEEVGRDPGRLRIAFTDHPFLGSTVDPAIREMVRGTAMLLEELGHEVVEARPEIDGPAFAKAFVTMLCGEIRADIREGERLLGRRANRSGFERDTWALALLGDQLSAADYVAASRVLQRTAAQLERFLRTVDILLTPTLAAPPLRIGVPPLEGAEAAAVELFTRINAGTLLKLARAIDSAAATTFQFTPYTPLFNAGGQPAMSVPLHWTDDGLPIGMHFVAPVGDEATLFRLAGQLEAARPWRDRLPPVA